MSASRFSTLFESASAYLPEIGIAVFSASIPLHLVKDPDLVEFDVILDNQHILQTGVAQQPDERFVLQIELSKEGVRLINQQLNLKSDLPLYLSIEARVVSLDGLEIISENLLELGNLTFEAVYSLAEHLGYDRDALSTLNNLRPRGDSQTRLTSSESIWKLTPNSSDISDELLDEILEILNNRIQLVFTDHVLVERAQFSLRLKSLISVDYDRLLRLVTTLGRNNVFYSALTPEVGSPIPTDAHLLLDENDILSVKLEKAVEIEINDGAVQKLQNLEDKNLYLAIDNKVISLKSMEINPPNRLILNDLPAEEAAFVTAVMDNDTLPVSLSFAPLSVGRSQEIDMSSYGQLLSVVFPDDLALTSQELDEVQEIIQNRFNLMFDDTTSVENEGGALTIVPDSNADPADIKTLVTHCGQAEVFAAPFPPLVDHPIPAGAPVFLTQDNFNGALYEEDYGKGLVKIGLTTEGINILKEELAPGSSIKLWLALDGKVFVDQPLVPVSAATLQITDLSIHDGRLLAAFLDNDLLPFELDLQPLSVDAYNTFFPEDHQVWYVEADNENGRIQTYDFQTCLDQLNQRAELLMPGLIHFEADDTWGIVIQFLSEDTPIDLDLLEKVVSQAEGLPVVLRINMEEV